MLSKIRETLKSRVEFARGLRREARSVAGDARHQLHLRLRMGRMDRRAIHLAACFLAGTPYAACEPRTRTPAREVAAAVEHALGEAGASADGVREWIAVPAIQPDPGPPAVPARPEPREERLYVVVRADLPPGLQAAQALHAEREFAAEHPEIEARWHRESNTVVILAVPDEDELFDLLLSLEKSGVVVSEFREPDLDLLHNLSLTAICVEPAAGPLLRHLPLAFSIRAA